MAGAERRGRRRRGPRVTTVGSAAYDVPAREVRDAHRPWTSDEPALLAWDHLLEVEDRLAAVQLRGVADGSPEWRAWSDTLDDVAKTLSGENPPFLQIVQLAERLGRHLASIARAPRRLLRRERRMVRIDDVKVLDAASRRWLARRSGTRLAEKADPRGRVLAVVRRGDVRILENRVARFVVERVLERSAPYLEAYGESFAEHSYVRSVRRALEGARAFLDDEELRAVDPPAGEVRPSFALTRDIHYRPVWDMYCRWIALDELAERRFAARRAQHTDLLRLVAASVLQARLGGVLDGPLRIGETPESHGSRLDTPFATLDVLGVRAGRPVIACVGLDGTGKDTHADALAISLYPRNENPQGMIYAASEEALQVPLGPSLRGVRDAVSRWMTHLGLEASSLSLDGLTRLRSVGVGAALCLGGPWTSGNLDGVVCTVGSRDGSRRIDGAPVCHPLAGGLMLSDRLWSGLEAGSELAADVLAALVFAEPSSGGAPRADTRVLLVPDSLGLRGHASLSARVGHRRVWLLPRSVAVALGVGALEGAREVCVLSLGGPFAELHRLDRREDGAWRHRAGATRLDWKAIDLVRALLRKSLEVADLVVDDEERAVAAMLACRTALESAWGGLDAAVDIPLGDRRWARLRVSGSHAREVLRQCATRLRELISTAFSPDDTLVVEGPMLSNAGVQSAFLDALESLGARILVSPTGAIDGGEAFLWRQEHDLPTWVEVLPRVDLLATDHKKNREWRLVFEGDELAPGAELPPHRWRNWGKISVGPFVVDLPLRVGGAEYLATWRRPGPDLSAPLPFDVDVRWRAGLDGLVVSLVPADATVPLRVEWRNSSDASVPNQYPTALLRGDFDRLEPLRVGVQGLESALRGGDSSALQKAMKTVCGQLPLEGWQREPTEGEGVRALAQSVSSTVLWLLDEREPEAREWRASLGLDQRRRHALQHGENIKVALGMAGRLGGLASARLLEAVAARLPALVPDRRGRRGAALAGWRGDAEFEQLLHAAGRLWPGPPMTARTQLRDALVSLAEAVESRTLGPILTRAWCWALGTALLLADDSVTGIPDDEAGPVTTALLARGDALCDSSEKDEERSEVVFALLALLRLRRSSESTYGPGAPWTMGISEALTRWRASADESVVERPMRFRIGSAPSAWTVLEEMLQGRHPSLVTVVEGGRR